MLYMIIYCGAIDQTVETPAQVKKEIADLVAMGCERSDIKVKEFATWAEHNAYEDKLNS